MTHEEPNQKPPTGRSRSSTLSGSFGPITPNPSTSPQQHHERRASFLGSLLGFSGTNWPSSSSGGGSTFASPSADGSSTSSTPWGSPSSSLAETDSTALSSVDGGEDFPKARAKAMSMSMSTSPFHDGGQAPSSPIDVRGADQEAKMGAGARPSFGSWGRAASWMAERGMTVEAPIEPPAPARRPSMTYFRRPFELPSYSFRDASTSDARAPPPPIPPPTSAIDSSPVDSGFAPLSRVLSAPSAPDHSDGLDHEAKRGRQGFGGWWARDAANRPKRRLSPMGERMIRGDVVH